MRRATLRTVGRLVFAALAATACGSKDKPAENPPPPAPSSASATASGPLTVTPSVTPPPAPAASAPSASALGTVLMTDPNQLAQMYAAAAAAANATSVGGGAAGGGTGDPLEVGLKATAAKHAPGMRPEGAVAKGMLQEGGHLAMMVNLQAGKCYAVVGYSPSNGVKDLDLHLLAPPLYNVLSGEDTTDDNMPTVGKAPNPLCPVIPVTIPYKVDIFAQKGGGSVAVQLYSK